MPPTDKPKADRIPAAALRQAAHLLDVELPNLTDRGQITPAGPSPFADPAVAALQDALAQVKSPALRRAILDVVEAAADLPINEIGQRPPSLCP